MLFVWLAGPLMTSMPYPHGRHLHLLPGSTKHRQYVQEVGKWLSVTTPEAQNSLHNGMSLAWMRRES